MTTDLQEITDFDDEVFDLPDGDKIKQTRRDRYSDEEVQMAHVRIPESYSKRLDIARLAERHSKNDLVVMAIAEWLERHGY